MASESRRRSGVLLRACPQCGQARLRRVSRDAEGSLPEPPRQGRHTRMRCAAEGCGFEGWVPRRLRRRSRLRPWPRVLRAGARRVRRALPQVLGLSLAALAWAAIGVAWERQHPPAPADLRAALPAGEYHDGDPLPQVHPLAQARARSQSPLDLRATCVWGRPGRDPYRGSVAEALAAARVPADARAELLARHAERRHDGRLLITREGIVDTAGGRRFEARGFAMTYGRTLCLDTRVNFVPGHAEPADLYEATDSSGRRWSMMVPDVCGNVSLISAAGQRLAQGLQVNDRVTGGGDPGDDPEVNEVPEPGTLAMLLAAALAWWAARRLRR